MPAIGLIVWETHSAQTAMHFELYDAYMVNAVASFDEDCADLSCIRRNFVTELISWICKNYADPSKREQLTIAQAFLTDTMDVMHNVYPIAAKYFLQSGGFWITTTTRRNVGEFPEAVKEELGQLSRYYDQLQEVLGVRTTKG